MSQKFKLVQDRDNDSASASIQRHLSVASLIVIVPIVALFVLSLFYSLGMMKQSAIIADQKAATATKQASYAITKTAMPSFKPHPASTPLPLPAIKNQTLLRMGPGLEFGTLGSINKGTPVTLVGRDVTGDWYMLDNRAWIAAAAISGDIPDLPIEPR